MTTLTITKLNPPLVLNGETAEYSVTTEFFRHDNATATDVLLRTTTENLFGVTKEELISEYSSERDDEQSERDRERAKRDARIAELDKVVTELERR
jgi:hypothetical protein